MFQIFMYTYYPAALGFRQSLDQSILVTVRVKMETSITLIFLLMACTGSQAQSSGKKNFAFMMDVVELCSKYCASRSEPDCKKDKPAVYAPLDEINGSKSPGENVEVTIYGDSIGGPSLVDGHKGKAIYLPNKGTYDNNYLDLGRFAGECINDIDLCENGYTVSFWYKIAEGNHKWPVLASASDWQIWTLASLEGGNAPYMSWFKKDGIRYDMGYSRTIPEGEWHHIALVARSRTDVRFFVDGEMIADKLKFERRERITIKDIEIGCYARSNCVGAAFDEVKIWEEAKSDEEIKALYLSKKRR